MTNALKFDLSGVTVDFNIAQIRLNHSYGVREICVKIATAFAAATLQVSLDVRLSSAKFVSNLF